MGTQNDHLEEKAIPTNTQCYAIAIRHEWFESFVTYISLFWRVSYVDIFLHLTLLNI